MPDFFRKTLLMGYIPEKPELESKHSGQSTEKNGMRELGGHALPATVGGIASLNREIKFSHWLRHLSQSIWAAITKYHTLSSL